jgi:hypothetical protein
MHTSFKALHAQRKALIDYLLRGMGLLRIENETAQVGHSDAVVIMAVMRPKI